MANLRSYPIRQHGEFLATRHCARHIRAAVVTQLIDAEPDARIILDFADVAAITVGFADELVANLAAAHGPRIAVTGAAEDVATAIRTALKRRELADQLDTATAPPGTWEIDLAQLPDRASLEAEAALALADQLDTQETP